MLIKTNESERLSAIYNKLTPDVQIIVDAAILVFEPISFTNFEDLYVSHFGKTLKAKFKEVYSLLRNAGIIAPYEYYNLVINEVFLVNMLPRLLNDPQYQPFSKLVNLKLGSFKDSGYYQSISPLRFLRIFIFGNIIEDYKLSNKAMEIVVMHSIPMRNILVRMVLSGNYLTIFKQMPSVILSQIAFATVGQVIYPFANPNFLIQFLEMAIQLPETNTILKNKFYHILLLTRLYQGNTKQFNDLDNAQLAGFAEWPIAIGLMYSGDLEKAKMLFFTRTALYRSEINNKKYFPEIHSSFFYLILLMVHKPGTHYKELEQLVKLYDKAQAFTDRLMHGLILIALEKKYEANKLFADIEKSATKIQHEYLLIAIYLIAVFILEEKLSKSQQTVAEELLEIAKTNNYLLIAMELEWILNSDKKNAKQNILPGITPLLSRLERKEAWEQSLTNLLGIGGSKSKALANVKPEDLNRIIYLVDFNSNLVQPMLQTLGKTGWSKGRNIALKRLKDRQIEGMSEQDNRIASAIKLSNSYYGNEYYFDFDKALPEMAGHPLMFMFHNPDISVELVKSQPELITEKTAKGFELSCDIDETEKKVILKKETNTRYRLIQLTDQQISVIRALNAKKLIIPAKGQEKLAEAIAHVSGFMTIHSDLAATNENIRSIDADSRIRVQLLPMGDSLKVEWFVKPFGTVPPYCKPGKGGKTVYGVLENEKCVVSRNITLETENTLALTNVLAEVLDTEFVDGSATFTNPYDSLSMLEVLRANQEIAVAEWPEGERFRVKRSASFKQLQIKVSRKGNWFEMSGELKVDEDTVISIQQLLASRAKSKGRFIEIGDGEYLALSAELKKQLDELAMYSVLDKNDLKINKFAAHTLEEIGRNAGSFKTDKAWTAFQKKIKNTEDLVIEVPTTLQAELRPYQEEGFRWMTRLAAWDAGACLADDMGLGKTLQALALLLYRAPQGPAIVVCPASVVNNWVSETQRFAPSLNVRLLGQTNRTEALENPSAFDIFVITYGILQSEEERIGNVAWETVVLDEAHAIKNTTTKTSKAAMTLQAGFRLILTGTPIQNHLGELWSLFNFINPGLLGSLQQFNQRFVTPNVIDGGASDKQYLKKLIAPFMLRRTKAKVLDELPPKTEITHKVELSAAEMGFYEALRRQAILSIETDEGPTGQKHLKALAEITRLRLACCNPSLVDKTIKLPSAKLDAFFEIVDELLENKHRALVFSQFIGHLSIVREALEKRKITYQYLDGSTPVQERGTIVKNFQTGTGELFLISLKAGGLGLNLTAADYVIHLDPWWNPAIEDQASDRAHRIGQTRPVTIYRLVAKDTIEEKIIALHNTKRDMADSLLEGTDQAAKLSTVDLLNLLKEL